MRRQLRRSQFTVAWISALSVELAAAQEMLDEEYRDYDIDLEDVSSYTFGRVGDHDVVLASLPAGRMGISPAAVMAGYMLKDFPSLRYGGFGLMVGIGGGVPSPTSDIRLGDVVVSHPQGGHGGVIQYDFGKAKPGEFQRTGSLNAPSTVLLNAVTKLKADHFRSRSKLGSILSEFINRAPKFGRDTAGPDRLFKSHFQHAGDNPTCDWCGQENLVHRPPRDNDAVVVHYGAIASGNQVIRDGITRDNLSSQLQGVLCFEMEAAGLMDTFPCLVIRGICDYADSHKNKTWQPYAAATAAAYAKELLQAIASPSPSQTWQAQSSQIESSQDSNPGQEIASATTTSQPTSLSKYEFEKAINEFKKKSTLSQGELREYQQTKLRDLEVVMSQIQQKQSQNRRLRYMKRLQPFIEGMQGFQELLDFWFDASDLLCFVWGPMKQILQVSSAVDDAFDAILDIYDNIGEQIPPLASYQPLFTNKPHLQTVLVMIFQDILAFQFEALKYFQEKVWRQLFHATWKSFPLQSTRIRTNFERHRHLILNGSDLAQFEEVQRSRRLEDAELEAKRKGDLEGRRKAVLQWLSAADSETVHERHVNARASNPNSGEWLMHDQNFIDWFDPKYCKTPLLWLNGKPGAGKSVLASRVIDQLRTVDDVSLCFFYCNENDPQRNSFLAVARGILCQLLPHDENLLLHMDKKRQESSDAVLSRIGMAKEFLKLGLRRRKSYVVIDGIDECEREQRKEICSFFQYLVNSLPRKNMDEIRCLFVSQDDGIARKDLSILPTLAMREEDNNCDIEAFSRHWEIKIEEKFGAFDKNELDIANVVTNMAHGIFIYAKCVLHELYHQPFRQALLDEWRQEKFPKELNEVYRRVLKRVAGTGPESRQRIVQKLLGWIACANRPLRWHEIQGAISVDLDDASINNDNLRLVEDCKELLASLVEIYPDETVTLVHPTVKVFLFREFKEERIIHPSSIHHELSSLSIRYLCFPDFFTSRTDEDIKDSLMSGQYAFYEYAVANWVPHLLAWLHAEPTTDDIQALGEDMEQLLRLHYSEPQKTSSKFELSKMMEEKLKTLQSLHCYTRLVQAIVWSRKQLLVDHKENNPGSESHQLLGFPAITQKIRKALEEITEWGGDEDMRKELEKYYGTNFFKCSKVYCQHFYKGFSNREDRDKHVARHDRPHRCSFEGCPTATFGCVSKADLEKHMVQYHGNQPEFPNLPSNSKEEANKKRTYNPTRYQCDRCPRMFTGKHNLNSHIRSHLGEKPFTCRYCNKAFVRKSDTNRHEKTCKKAPSSQTGYDR